MLSYSCWKQDISESGSDAGSEGYDLDDPIKVHVKKVRYAKW